MRQVSKRLGKGLSTLIDHAVHPSETELREVGSAQEPTAPAAKSESRSVPIGLLRPNRHQPRLSHDDAGVAQLARSLEKSGIIQPILVRPDGEQFEIIAGERRFRAAKLLGWTEVPVLVRKAAESELLELALVENIHREDLNAIDRAVAYREYCDRFSANADALAERIGEDRSTVTNYMRLLELPKAVRDLVASRQLSMGHARCLLALDSPKEQEQAASEVLVGQLSVRATEALVRDRRSIKKAVSRDGASKATGGARPLIESLARKLEESLGVKVRIIEGVRKGTGRILIEYASLDDFDRICERLGIDRD